MQVLTDRLARPGQAETPEEIALAIRETFPNIPEDSIQLIVKHSFEDVTKVSHHCGSNATD